jgi:uncharacterized protein (DUF934 family)
MIHNEKIWTPDGFIADDPWTVIEPEDESVVEAFWIVPLARYLELTPEQRRGLAAGEAKNSAGVGVWLQPGDDPSALKDHLDELSVIALNFPKYSDGRAFSHAAVLRGQMGFTGDLRAVGDVLIDQVPLMLRVGFTSFAVTNETALKRLAEGRLPGIDLHYQPSVLPAAQTGTYSWRRQTA